jgi:hypothetical protein
MCRATPDVDLTKNPKSLGKDLAKGAKNALPDVSAVPTREEIIANVTPLSLRLSTTLPSILNALLLAMFVFLFFLMCSWVRCPAGICLTCLGFGYASGHSACTHHMQMTGWSTWVPAGLDISHFF